MSINEAKDALITITEAVWDAGGCYNCVECPFHNIITSSDCPFDECPGMWELRTRIMP